MVRIYPTLELATLAWKGGLARTKHVLGVVRRGTTFCEKYYTSMMRITKLYTRSSVLQATSYLTRRA